MSGIKYEVLTGDDLISALRGGRTGDLLDDAAYAAADEIERLRGLLRECEPAVYSQHMIAIGTRIAKPPTLLARVRATLAGAYAASITDPTDAVP
jgi:hypothetical protein